MDSTNSLNQTCCQIFVFAPPIYFLPPSKVSIALTSLSLRFRFRLEKAFGFRRRRFFNFFFFLEITCFWLEKPSKFLILARKSLQISAKTFFFGDHLIFTKNSPKSNSGMKKIWVKSNAGFQLCPPDFSFAPPISLSWRRPCVKQEFVYCVLFYDLCVVYNVNCVFFG